MRQRRYPRRNTEQQREAVQGVLGGEGLKPDGGETDGIERGKDSALLPQQQCQRDQGGGEQHRILDDLGEARRAHACGKTA